MVVVCFFNSLPNGEYSNLSIVAAFFSKSFSSKIYFPVKNSYLLTFLDDKIEFLAVCLSKSYTHFYNKFFQNLNGLSDDKVVSFTKNEYGSLV